MEGYQTESLSLRKRLQKLEKYYYELVQPKSTPRANSQPKSNRSSTSSSRQGDSTSETDASRQYSP